MSTAAIAVMARKKRMVRKFREAGATSPENAIAPQQQHIRPSFLFQRMVQHGVFKSTGQDLYYLDEVREAELRNRRLKGMMLLVAGMIIIFTVVYFMKNN